MKPGFQENNSGNKMDTQPYDDGTSGLTGGLRMFEYVPRADSYSVVMLESKLGKSASLVQFRDRIKILVLADPLLTKTASIAAEGLPHAPRKNQPFPYNIEVSAATQAW
ncbi:hypothetical protein MMC28_006088 [Mycoblastus sanguinarius]|nr:hypothetical protein [Mycoblastus sanguinarius]